MTATRIPWASLAGSPLSTPQTTLTIRSGANNVTGAVIRILALLFRTNQLTFSVTTTNPLALQPTRTYYSFSDAASDVVKVRIYEGIHFRFADTTARKQGSHVAKWTFEHFLRRVEDDDNHHGKH